MRTRRHTFHLLFPIFFVLIVSLPRSLKAQDPAVSIAGISFEGNQSLSDMQLRQQLRMAIERTRYNPEALKADLRRLEQIYKDEGFLKAKLGPPEVQIKEFGTGRGAFIRIPVAEGPRYSLDKLSIRNIQAFETQTIAQMCPLQKGQPYVRSQIIQWQEKIVDAYNEIGYARAGCTTQESVNDADKTVDCTLDCVEGRIYTVGKIALVADESIDRRQFRRHLLLSEGGIYSFQNLALSVQFLNQMGIYKRFSYSDVQISIDDTKGTVDVTFHLSPRAQQESPH